MSNAGRVLYRDRAIVVVALSTLVVVAWVFLWRGAGMGMSATDMTTFSLFPHLQRDISGDMGTPRLVVVLMWWVMMIAMMTPGAVPFVLLYNRVLRHHSEPGVTAVASPLLITAGYLVVWFVFSLAAALLQEALQPTGLISKMMLWSRSAWLSASVLVVAGIYQFSPFKQACLAQCRGPIAFLTKYWKPGWKGAFLLGVRHGAYCVGCCWTLMLLLFVGGVMNLVWIVALTVLVLVEKLLPAGVFVGKCTGVILIIWALATLLV